MSTGGIDLRPDIKLSPLFYQYYIRNSVNLLFLIYKMQIHTQKYKRGLQTWILVLIKRNIGLLHKKTFNLITQKPLKLLQLFLLISVISHIGIDNNNNTTSH